MQMNAKNCKAVAYKKQAAQVFLSRKYLGCRGGSRLLYNAKHHSCVLIILSQSKQISPLRLSLVLSGMGYLAPTHE